MLQLEVPLSVRMDGEVVWAELTHQPEQTLPSNLSGFSPTQPEGSFGLVKNIFKNDLTNAIKHAIVIYMNTKRLPSLPAGVGQMVPGLAPAQQTATPVHNLRGGGAFE